MVPKELCVYIQKEAKLSAREHVFVDVSEVNDCTVCIHTKRGLYRLLSINSIDFGCKCMEVFKLR